MHFLGFEMGFATLSDRILTPLLDANPKIARIRFKI
jgi:hypothetical protein